MHACIKVYMVATRLRLLEGAFAADAFACSSAGASATNRCGAFDCHDFCLTCGIPKCLSIQLVMFSLCILPRSADDEVASIVKAHRAGREHNRVGTIRYLEGTV